ncbi:DEAD-box type RNA helicase, partial [Ascosphaera acerosa]
MAELVESLGDEDMTLYDSDYVDQCHQRDTKPDPAIANAIETAKHRREQFLTCTQLLAFNSDEGEVAESQAWIWAKLQGALERCDLCIKEYYKGKLWLMGQLRQTYDEAEVEKFGKILDSWDISRICANLDQAKDMLLAAPTDKRTLAALDRPRLLSIFEALSCSAFLDDNEAMSKHFDQPFQLVQTRRLLKILDYVPASTKLLFDADEFRRRWAASSWAKYKRPPSTVEFEWAIKDPLMRILQVGSVPPVPEDVVLRLWQGISLIVRRLDSQQITHQLRALPIDPIRLSVDHIGVTTPAFRPLINTIHTVIEKTPGDFWEAAQTASPQAFIEAVFYNPQFAVFLTEASDTSNSEAQGTFQDMLSWISPFMASLKSDHRPQACRTLISQLLNRIQRKDFGDNVKYHSFIAGLAVLIGTLRTFTDNEASRGSVAQVVLSDILQVISENIERFLKPPTFTGEQDDKKLKTMCMDVVRNTLALECQSLKADYEAILRSSDLQHGVSTYSPHIWDAVVRGLQDQDTDLSSATLLGILPLVGLEKFITKSAESEQKTHFNVIYGHLTHLACQVLERLADFSTAHVLELLRRSDTNCSLVSALFSADLNTYQAAIDLIKAVSGQPGRREAIAHLISLSPTITIRGFGWSFRRISAMKTFSSAPRMVKTGTDIVNVLCDPEIPGILRKKISDVEEARALKGLWQHQWQSLATVFECTEQWHQMGNDRSVMLEFCRDTIQFAALLFDQFSVFVSALADFDAEEPMPANTALLHPLTATMRWMVRWLRLKDEYLAHTLVELVLKVLHYLAELKVTISQDALGFIEAVALTSTVRTILTDQEKAELIRALETYYGKPLVSAPEVKPVVDKAKVSAAGKVGRQSRIDSFARPADTVSVSSSTSDETVSHIKKGDESSEVPDDVSLDLTGLNELRKRA